MEAATAESAAKTAAMESAAEAPTGISRGRRKGTERGYRGEGNHRFTKHDTLLHIDVRGHKRCRRRIVAPGRAEQELNSPARVQNLGMSSERRPMSGSYCRRDACAISDKTAPFSPQSLPDKAIVHVGGEPFGSRYALQHDEGPGHAAGSHGPIRVFNTA